MPFDKNIDRIKGFLSVQEAGFLHKLAWKTVEQFGEGSVLCEIGCFCGKSTVAIASALKEQDKGVLYSIDWHQGSASMLGYGTPDYESTYEEFVDNLKEFAVEDRVRVIKNKSEDSTEAVPEKLHFLWIDGSHEYNAVKADFDNYSKKIADGGYLLFHDACWTSWRDPLKVIEDEVLDDPRYCLYACVGNMMIFRKTSNRLSQGKRRILKGLLGYTSGEDRPLFPKALSFLLLRLTTFYALHAHDWRQ